MQDVSRDQELIDDAQTAMSELVLMVANAVTRGVPIGMRDKVWAAGVAHAENNMPHGLEEAQADAARLGIEPECVVPDYAHVRPPLRLVDDRDDGLIDFGLDFDTRRAA